MKMNRFIEEYDGKSYDIIVIGGGITGAAVAYEAASRGYSVALVEKGDFGAATSSATSKLIHGGLRYLAYFEFGLVRESLRERRILENIAPNLVYPLPFIIPLYKTGIRNIKVLEPGMILYDILSFDKAFTWDNSKKLPHHRFLSRKKVLELEPVVNPEGLTGGILYYDCLSIAPERLTLAFIKSAIKYGAEVSNYTKVEQFISKPGGVGGVIVRDVLSGNSAEIRGKIIINCGGPWADLLLKVAGGVQGSGQIRRSEGIHIITKRLTNCHAVGGLSPSGQACNLYPWRGYTLIGTTDREYNGDPDAYEVTREKVEEFLEVINSAFGKDNLVNFEDILHVYGGLRPLVDDQTEEVYNTSRKYEIYDNQPEGLEGLITVEGGKYTTSRNLAENVLKLAVKKLGGKYSRSKTTNTFLAGCDIPDIEAFVSNAILENSDFKSSTVEFLARHYGTEYPAILDIARNNPEFAIPLNPDGEITAQVIYSIREEMAYTLEDILLRRTGIGTLGNPGNKISELVARLAADELGWNNERIVQEVDKVTKIITPPK